MNEDERLKAEVMRELEWDPQVDAARIGVSVAHGAVTPTAAEELKVELDQSDKPDDAEIAPAARDPRHPRRHRREERDHRAVGRDAEARVRRAPRRRGDPADCTVLGRCAWSGAC
jgi:hypothetical protein